MFVSNLAFNHQHYIDTAKIAIFIASLLAAILGILIILMINKKR
jgi:Na+/H+ antiporter NhaA